MIPENENTPRIQSLRARGWLLLIGLAGTTLAPFIYYYSYFAQLFWFGDELDLIDQWDRIGISRWLWSAFAENFAPLFKLFYTGLVFLGNGSYAAVLATIWVNHGLNVGLLGYWMLRNGFGASAVSISCLVFGLSATHLETLTWGVQWCAILSVTFFILAAILEVKPIERSASPPFSWLRTLMCTVACAASALTFSRGILTGCVMACSRLDPTQQGKGGWTNRAIIGGLYLIPPIIVTLILLHVSQSSNRPVFGSEGGWRNMGTFGFWYLAANPVPSFFLITPVNWGMPPLSPISVSLLGLLKVAIIGTGFYCSKRNQRSVLAALLALELSNAVLLGYGRGEADFGHAMSSRYQYISLLCYLPFVAQVMDCFFASLPNRFRIRTLAYGSIVAVLCYYSVRPWHVLLPPWVDGRGATTRRLLFETHPIPEGNDLPGIPFLPNQRAKQLAEKYNLH